MDYAAHISQDRVQSVRAHCTNTAELCSKYCSAFGAESIGRLAGLLHDAGKLCSDFDLYIRHETDTKRGEIDHSYAGAKFIMDCSDKETSGAARLIARVIISHHGLHDWVDENCKDYFNIRISNTKNYEQIKDNIPMLIDDTALRKLLKKASDEYKELQLRIKSISKEAVSYSFYMGMLERMIESSLIDADRTDTASFMDNTEIADNDGCNEIWHKMNGRMEKRLSSFESRTDLISRQRRSISDRCAEYANNNVRICQMIVPTGGGKTLSSLRFAIDYCLKHGMNRIIYTAPFMSILEQNSAEIKDISGDDNFIEHHSNALAEISSDDGELRDYELHTERWDKPVVATTMVQLLNAFFLGKTSSVRRLHRLAGSVIIIDEVQSMPLKCVHIFDLAVNFISHICGAAVVLCTATQPETENVRYPLMLDENSSMTGDYAADFEVFRRTEMIPDIDPYGYSYEEAADYCEIRFSIAGNLLVIVNTKKAALQLYDLMKEKCGENAQVIHLSTNMCPQHRRDKIEQIRLLLDRKEPVICITTQLIEAGVDISFKCVVRSLAGIDSAVQAAGRCNRHGENSEPCPVYLIKLKEERIGSLEEISSAQGITQQMAESGRYPDISSPSAVSDYFRKLYDYEKDKLSYPVPERETLLNYLSLNKNRYEALPGKTCSKFESQAFKTAGSLFRVIDDNTQGVIVPYNEEAMELISKLELGTENTSALLRKAQKFTVNVYSGTERSLYENNALRVIPCGVVILDKAYYKQDIGIQIAGVEKELLIF